MVIDNTNIMHWEMTPYLRMAHLYRFVTLLAEPRTAGTPQECAARSKHGVTEALIAAKLKKLRNNFIFPLYYGFMVSAVDSGSLRLWAAKLARAMLQTDGMSDVADSEGDLLVNEFVGRTDADLVQWKERQDLLHCTAFYTGYGKRPGEGNADLATFFRQAFFPFFLKKILKLKKNQFLFFVFYTSS